MSRAKANALLLLTAAIWGSTFTVTKLVAGVFSPYFILVLRFTLASAFLAVPCIRRRQPIDKTTVKMGLIMGGTLFAAYLVHTIGLALDTTPGKSAFLTAVYCVLVPFLQWGFAKERPLRHQFAAAFLCLSGIGLISVNSGFSMTTGDAVTLVGGVFCALNLIAISIGCKGRDVLTLTTLQMCTAALLSWISVAVTRGFPQTFTVPAFAGAAYLGLFATALCIWMQATGIRYTSPTVAAILLSLESIFGVLFSVFFYGETITPRMLMGFALVFGAILLSQKKEKEPVKNEKEAVKAGQ